MHEGTCLTRFNLIDWGAFTATLILSLAGILFVYSATSGYPTSSLFQEFWFKQVIWLVLGMVSYFFLSQWDYRTMVDRSGMLYLLGLLFLVAVLLWGAKINGARSWFRLPLFSIQPSEFVKVTTLLFITKYFGRFQESQSSFFEFLGSALLVGLPVVLIFLQPDMGTAFLYFPFFLIPNFLVGNREIIWTTMAGFILVASLIALVLWQPKSVFFLKDYQKARIQSFFRQEENLQNQGYQVHQSKISIGQGGMFGQGFAKGTQTRLGFLPAQHNDFILAVAAEEFGFLGMFVLFSLFAFLFMRLVTTARAAPDAAGALLVAMVFTTLGLQTVFNASMLIGLVPTTGIPCPLLSYGGSSAMSSWMLLGLAQSVQTHRYFA
jgi:rod shape determining protein RodA